VSDPRPIKLFIVGAFFTFAVIVMLILILVPPQGLQ
jgi:hypothetical protein